MSGNCFLNLAPSNMRAGLRLTCSTHLCARAGAGGQEEREPKPGGGAPEDRRLARGARRLQQGAARAQQPNPEPCRCTDASGVAGTSHCL